MSAAPSMVDVCLIKSLPAQLVKPCHPFLSLTPTPIRSFHLSCSASSSPSSRETLSLRKKASFLPFVARTSDWKQEDLLAQEEEEEESGIYEWEGEGERTAEEEVFGGVEAGLSEWEEDDEKGGVGAVAEGEAPLEGEPYPEPPEEAKLFVGNLPFDMDSEKLAQLFDQAGVVEVAEVVYNRETDRSRGFGFVTMSSIEEAEKATEMFNRQYVEGRLLTVNQAAPRGSRLERAAPRDSAPTFRIYVGNLPWSADDARLEQVFSEHGKVVDGRVVYDRESGRSRGFGFVTMSTQQEMDDAIAALDGQNLDGRAIRVNAAEERPRRPSF